MTISKRLKEERIRLGLSQAQFAGIVGASTKTQNRWEQEDGAIPNAADLAAWAGVGADVLFIVTGLASTSTMQSAVMPVERIQVLSLGERLKQERIRFGMNQTDFARLGSVSKGSQILYEKGDGAPTSDYLAGVAAAGVDVQYVLTGVQSSVALSPEEILLIGSFRTCPQLLKAAALRVLVNTNES